MNLTTDQFIRGLERSVSELPSVLNEWESLDQELRTEYADQLDWMLRTRQFASDRAASEGRGIEIAQRVAAVNAALFAVRAAIADTMGLSVEGETTSIAVMEQPVVTRQPIAWAA